MPGYDIGASLAASSSSASSMGGAPFYFAGGGGSGVGPFSSGSRSVPQPIWPLLIVAAAVVLVLVLIFKKGRR